MGQIKYLISNERDLLWGVAATTIGLQDGHPGESYPYGEHPSGYLFTTEKGRILDEYTLVYIYKGKGWFWSAHSSKTAIKAGDAFLVFPGEWHNYAPDPEIGWSEAWIGFKGDYIDRLVKEKFFDLSRPIFHVGVDAFLWQMFADAYKIAVSQEIAFQQHLAGYVNMILSSVYAVQNQPHQHPASEVTAQIVKAKNIMMDNVCRNMKMEDIANIIGLGYSKFRKEFKVHTGFSPGQYYTACRLAKAKDLLLHTNLTSKEIAYELGFDSPSYFYEIFRQHEGVPPTTFRKELEI